MEEILRVLQKHNYALEEVEEIFLGAEGPEDVDTIYQVAAAKDDDLHVKLAVDKEMNLIVINDLNCPEDRLKETLLDLNRVSLNLDSDTVLVQSEQCRFPLWKNQGFTKHYQSILSGSPQEMLVDKINDSLEEAAERIAPYLGEDIQVYEVASDLPYIYSVQLTEKSAEGPLDADYHCDLHYHELTGAVYLDRLWIPDDKRRQGIGTATVDFIKESLERINANYLYLKATASSESFWDRREDFDAVYRLNLRWARRMRLQLKRDPSWDRVYVRGERLAHPLDFYGNHPGEDWDFYQAQELLQVVNKESKNV